MKRDQPITILGAGLVGSLLACRLQQLGFQAVVYEKRSDPRKNTKDQGRSINLVVTSRGWAGLRLVGLEEKALQLAVPVYGRMMHAKSGETVFQPYGRKNECNHSVSRKDLNCFLITEAEKVGAKIHFDQDLQQVNLSTRQLVFANGNKSSYTHLFATDGAGSLVRKALSELPGYSQQTQWLEADYKELHISSEIQKKFSMNSEALHIWARGTHMMMALANLDGGFTVTLYLPKTGHRFAFDLIRSPEAVSELFESEFPDAQELIPDHVTAFLENPQGSLGTVRCDRWIYKDEICLMGDAAHAIVPFFGQGMNCGFEDVLQLDRLLQDEKTWSAVFEKFFVTRKPNADAIADMALENWVEMKEKVADAEFLRRKKIEAWLEQEFPDVFKSRYGLITYTLTPYATTQKIGRLQDELWRQISSLPLEHSAVAPFLEKYARLIQGLSG